MKSLKESLIFELNSSTYASAHDKEVARNGKETNRSRRFAVAAGKALTAELAKAGLVDKKTGKLKANKRAEALPLITKALSDNPIVKKAIQESPDSFNKIKKRSPRTITVKIPGYIDEDYEYHKGTSIKLPNATYYIYNDKYHGDLHISSINDMLGQIGLFIDDYEGFGPEDIVYKSNNPKKIIKYAVNTYGEWDEDGKVEETGTLDDPEWAQRVLDDEDEFDDDDYNMIDNLSIYNNALVDDNGYVYYAYDDGGFKDHTEKYQDYIKRVKSEENK